MAAGADGVDGEIDPGTDVGVDGEIGTVGASTSAACDS